MAEVEAGAGEDGFEQQFLSLLAEQQQYEETHRLEFFEPYDYQKDFYHAKGFETDELARERFLKAANQIGKCNSVSTEIETDNGARRLKDVWGKPNITVVSWDGAQVVYSRVLRWIRKPAQECFRVTLSDGRWFESPAGHLVYDGKEWVSLRDLFERLPESVFSHPPTSSALGRLILRPGVLRWFGKLRGCFHRYWTDRRLCGGQLLYAQAGVQVFAPLSDDVRPYNRPESRSDVQGYIGTDTDRPISTRLSSSGVFRLISDLFWPSVGQVCTVGAELTCDLRPDVQPSPGASRLLRASGVEGLRQSGSVAPSWFNPGNALNNIISVYSVGWHTLYDMDVERTGCYFAGGVLHHNTLGAAREVAYHLTGLYPDWWKGHLFDRPITCLVGSNTNETVRDLCQAELFGDPTDDEKMGTGAVPRHLIGEKTRKPGVPNAYDSVSVRHVSGGLSKVMFRAYEQGAKKHMGHRIDLGWCDEEPPMEIFSQYRRGTFATNGILMVTFTPEEGFTQLVYQIMNQLKRGQAMVEAGWDDAPHMTPEKREEFLARIPENERDMRARGIPKVGSGLVFPFNEEEIVIDPIQIQPWFRIICGVDFGIDHPFAAAWLAFDPDTQKTYLYDVWKKSGSLISGQCDAIKQRGDWIPVVWPHDGMQRDKQSGRPMADLYRDRGLRMMPKCFTNPPQPGQPEGTGGQGVEVGLLAMREAMEEGRFKVFSTCQDWINEQKAYHRVDGSVVKKNDDAISASRYAFQSLRFADTKPVPVRHAPVRAGLSNW